MSVLQVYSKARAEILIVDAYFEQVIWTLGQFLFYYSRPTKILSKKVTSDKAAQYNKQLRIKVLMGKGFILLTRGYGFMGGTSPLWHVKNLYFYLWYEVQT